MNNKWMSKLALACSFVFAAQFALASASITNDFESMSLGAVPGGADPRMPGNGQWWNPDNSASYGEVKAGIGLSGSQGLEVGNRGNGFDGVIDNVKSARLNEMAGETSVAPNSTFRSSFSFRTAATTGYADAGTQATRYRFRSETYGPDRTTFFAVNNDASGNLFAYAFGIDATANFVQTGTANIAWGAWYQLVTEISFADGGAANDVVTYSLFDSSNTLVWNAVSTTWEEGARQLGYNAGNIFGVDAVQFHARGGRSDALGATYVDALGYEAVPEPFTMAGLAAFAAWKRRKARKNA